MYPRTHFTTSSQQDFRSYDPEIYRAKQQAANEAHEQKLQLQASGAKPRRASPDHFASTNRSEFKKFDSNIYKMQLPSSRSGSKYTSGDVNVNDESSLHRSAVRHVSAKHFSTSSRTAFPAYSPEDYAQNESRSLHATNKPVSQADYKPRHVGPNHFVSTTKSNFKEYDLKKIIEQNKDVVPPSDAADSTVRGVRHVSAGHFLTSSRQQFAGYSAEDMEKIGQGAGGISRHQKEDEAVKERYKPRKVGPNHFVTSSKADFQAYDLS